MRTAIRLLATFGVICAACHAESRTSVALQDDAECRTLSLPAVLPSMKDVFSRVQKVKWNKGEYETSSEYNARIKQEISTLFPAGNRIYAYANMPKSYGNYSADEAMLSYTSTQIESSFHLFSVRDRETLKDRYYLGANISEKKGKLHRYTGQNTFGAIAEVEMQDAVLAEIAFRRFSTSLNTTRITGRNPASDVQGWSTNWHVAIKISPEAAQNERALLQIVVAGPLDAPYTLYDKYYLKPTISSPYGGETTTSAINLRVDCAYIRNRNTGKIYAAFKLPADR